MFKIVLSSFNSSRSDDRKDSPPVTEALKLSASPIKRTTKEIEIEKSKRPKNKTEVPKSVKKKSLSNIRMMYLNFYLII